MFDTFQVTPDSITANITVIQPSEPQEFLYKSRVQAPGK